MRTIVNAVLSVRPGLITIPVGLATAAKRNDPRFRTIHADCSTPIQEKRWCPTCVTELGFDQTVKGFEFAKGQFVQIEEEELTLLGPGRSRVLGLSKFVPVSSIDPIQVEKSYYLVPNETLSLPYVVLAEAMRQMKVCGIGKASPWGKEYPCVVVPHGRALVLNLLYCLDEVVPIEEITSLPALKIKLEKDDLLMTKQLVGMLTNEVVPSDLDTASGARLDELIQAKIAGVKLEVPAEKPDLPVTVDLQEALKASIDLVRAEN